MSWDKPFREPIELPDGNTLVSLGDADAYITLRKRSHWRKPGLS